MTDAQLYTLLTALQKQEHPMGSEQCATLLHMSVSSFKKDLSSLNQHLYNHGVQIIGKSGKGNGYQLDIINKDQWNLYYEQILPSHLEQQQSDFSNQETRILFLVQHLLETKAWTKSDDLLDQLAISKTQLTKDLHMVRHIFSRYEIQLHQRPHYGLKIESSEYNIRLCLANVISKSIALYDEYEAKTSIKENQIFHQIEEIILQQCEKFQYKLSSLTLNNLVVHLYISYRRVLEHQDIQLASEFKQEIQEDVVFPLAAAIVKHLQSTFHISFYDDEVYYVSIHLSSKQIVDHDTTNIDQNCMKLVERMIARINEQYNIDFTKNLNLKMMLAMHLSPLLNRIKYHITLKNPLLSEIKANFLVPYELSLCCAKVIEESYQYQLSEDEVGYFALHIKVALSQQTTSRKKDILLVCATGRGSAQLLLYQFQTQYQDTIRTIESCDVLQVKQIDLNQYDAIFTTVPLHLKDTHNPPIFFVDSLNASFQQEDIRRFLNSSTSELSEVSKYFPKQMFFGLVDAKNKEELIRLICRNIRSVYELPADFEESVLQREALAKTTFGSDVAFPHPSRIMTNDTFISVTMLKHPINWGDDRVKLVLLSSFEKGFIKQNQDVFKIISTLISNKKYVSMLVNHPDYETLLDVIRLIQKKEIV